MADFVLAGSCVSLATSLDRVKGKKLGGGRLGTRLLPSPLSPVGAMFHDPFKQSSFKANVFAGLLALNPFMLQNLRAFGQKLLIKRRILDELNLIFFRRRHLGFFFFHKTSIQSTKSSEDWTCQPLGLFNSPLGHAVAEAGLWQGLADLFRYPSEFGSHRRSAIFVHDRHPAIACFARGDVDRNLTEERNSQAPGFAFAAAAS